MADRPWENVTPQQAYFIGQRDIIPMIGNLAALYEGQSGIKGRVTSAGLDTVDLFQRLANGESTPVPKDKDEYRAWLEAQGLEAEDAEQKAATRAARDEQRMKELTTGVEEQ